jgi:hypothetical protein
LLVAAISMFVAAVLFLRGILVTILLVFYGVSLIRTHKKYGPLMQQRPSEPMLAQARELLKPLMSGRVNKVPGLIEFISRDAMARRWLRGLLLGNIAVFVSLEARMFGRSISEVMVLGPGGVEIEITGKVLLSKMQKGVLYLNNLHFKGMLSPVSYARYAEWKQGCQPQLTPPPPVPLP